MNWKVEIVKAKHWIGYDCQTAYNDPISDVIVPMYNEPLSSRSILEMEEFSQGDEGVVFIDSKTNKIGLLIRS
jgi:cellulose synthase/poly-beta-1,6-N-acetylglucosamine synthase-like glycosyltransferase